MIDNSVIPSFVIEDINPNDFSVNYFDNDLVFVDDMRKLPDVSTIKFRMNLTVVCLQGRLSVVLNGHRVELGERQLLIGHSNVIADSYMVSPNYKGKLLMVSDRLVKILLGQYIDVWQRKFYESPYILVSLSERDSVKYSSFHQLISMKIEEVFSQMDREAILALLQAALFDLCSRFQSYKLTAKEEDPPKSKQQTLRQGSLLFHRFLDLLTNTPIKRRPVSFYADQLSVSPKYLSIVCKNESGKSPHQWIREYTLADISYYLKSTTFSIKEISDRLKFPNLSFFGRYVRENFGVSPSRFRENLHKRLK